jgi:hypothetical protein
MLPKEFALMNFDEILLRSLKMLHHYFNQNNSSGITSILSARPLP